MCLLCTDANAQVSLSSCAKAAGFPPEALSGPVVYCVETTIKNAVTNALQNLSDYFKDVTSAVLILAVTMHGARMISGERGINAKSMTLLLKIVFVSYFSYNLGGFADSIFNIMDEVVRDVIPGNPLMPSPGSQPWIMIDNILGTLFGFAPGVVLSQGLLWLIDGLMSGTDSFSMSSSLIVAFLEMVLFVIEIIYTFLTSYIVVAFMLIMSPMFVPMIIFQVSERYFRRWLDIIIGAMLIPVMLFAALSFSLSLYTTLICNTFTTMLPKFNCTLPPDPNNLPDFSAFFNENQDAYSFNISADANVIKDEQNTMMKKAPDNLQYVPATGSTIDWKNMGGINYMPFRMPGINFGLYNKKTNRQLMFSLISIWIYTMLLKQLIQKMPEVAQEIAGVSIGIVLKQPKLKDKLNEIKHTVSGAAGVSVGAVVGGQLGQSSGNARVAEAGAIGGGIIGHVLARELIK